MEPHKEITGLENSERFYDLYDKWANIELKKREYFDNFLKHLFEEKIISKTDIEKWKSLDENTLIDEDLTQDEFFNRPNFAIETLCDNIHSFISNALTIIKKLPKDSQLSKPIKELISIYTSLAKGIIVLLGNENISIDSKPEIEKMDRLVKNAEEYLLNPAPFFGRSSSMFSKHPSVVKKPAIPRNRSFPPTPPLKQTSLKRRFGPQPGKSKQSTDKPPAKSDPIKKAVMPATTGDAKKTEVTIRLKR